jgi:hypothetical protein
LYFPVRTPECVGDTAYYLPHFAPTRVAFIERYIYDRGWGNRKFGGVTLIPPQEDQI